MRLIMYIFLTSPLYLSLFSFFFSFFFSLSFLFVPSEREGCNSEAKGDEHSYLVVFILGMWSLTASSWIF